VLQTLVDLLGRPAVHEAVAVTAAEVIVAFIIAVPLGAAAGIAIAENDYVGEIFKPVLFYVFSIPKSIFLPMFILMLGIGFQQKVAYAAFTTAFVVLMSATAAVESVRQDHIMVARSYGATQMQILLRVYVPSMMPVLLETLRISMIFNFTGVMIAEMYASRTGIGHMIRGGVPDAGAVRRRHSVSRSPCCSTRRCFSRPVQHMNLSDASRRKAATEVAPEPHLRRRPGAWRWKTFDGTAPGASVSSARAAAARPRC
jgi:ABC-type proline/glycine betaine transport system permease subunit